MPHGVWIALVPFALAAAILPAHAASPATSDGTGAPAARELRDCAECPVLLVVPPGRFAMGSLDGERGRDEGPVREVRIERTFALGKYEVTLGQFRRFVEATGHRVAPGCRVYVPPAQPGVRAQWIDDPQRSWADPGLAMPLGEQHPVVCVGRVDALAYAAWLRESTGKPYRLPSEAEWEYAARAGTTTLYYWGGNYDNGCRFANMYDRVGRRHIDFGWGFADCEDGFAELAPVGSLEPNAFGLHDMLGNVWEWLADCYRERYEGAPIDGSATPDAPDCRLYAVRGGAWMTRPSRQRPTFRGRDPNDARYNYFGFRIARDLIARDLTE